MDRVREPMPWILQRRESLYDLRHMVSPQQKRRGPGVPGTGRSSVIQTRSPVRNGCGLALDTAVKRPCPPELAFLVVETDPN
jgi:hypothetical protein